MKFRCKGWYTGSKNFQLPEKSVFVKLKRIWLAHSNSDFASVQAPYVDLVGR